MRLLRAALLVLLAGCRLIDADSVTGSLSENVDTVPTISWTTKMPTVGWVEYGATEGYGTATPLSSVEETDHAVALLGLPADTVVHYRVVADLGDREEVSEDHTITTGPLPGAMPAVRVDTLAEDSLVDGYTLFSWYEPDDLDAWVYVTDREGAVVWYASVDAQVLSTAFSNDGRAVLALASRAEGADTQLLRLPLDGGAPSAIAMPLGHHDFLELPDERGYAYIASEVRTIDGEEIEGDQLVEETPDGVSTPVWSAFDTMEVIPNEGWSQSLPDWTHANGVAYDPEQDLYLVSLYRQEQILAIDPRTGTIAWRLGEEGDFTFVDDDGFGPQHAPAFVEGGVLLFDNAAGAPMSRVVSYALDMDAHTATVVRQLPSPTGDRTLVEGCGEWFPDGGSLSAWGELRAVDTVSASGDLVRSLVVDEFGVVGSVAMTDTLYANP